MFVLKILCAYLLQLFRFNLTVLSNSIPPSRAWEYLELLTMKIIPHLSTCKVETERIELSCQYKISKEINQCVCFFLT